MIDIHCHLLPGIDDGSKDMATSLQLARDAVADGITHALMTPHHMSREYTNHPDDVIALTDQFQAELDAHDIPLHVYPCQEVHITGGLIAAIDAGDTLTCDEDQHYILLEFPHTDVPTYAEDMFFQVQQRGLIPIIVHPERNEYFMKHPDTLYDFIQRGALSQVTASSYVGTFGKGVAQFASDILTAGLAQVFASDAHHLPNRQYEMSAAFKQLTKQFGADYADLFQENAKAIINGTAVKRLHEQPVKKHLFAKY
ncbi:tyrosine-protein phosphatase [Lacticaseibacillus zhaodongensis]|uniref:tyrosine-protein phosphatase n=1 Tax=Lacticaseibacillus zhaodongensis TaxID=2668065 RepID=UPI0012D33ADC|nr:CpsB/CapC family capsule biosynthesis tyrosine phosphatase [Lacticaseibacillus zhaodongensis]